MSNQHSIPVGDQLGPFEYTITEEMADIHIAAINNSDSLFKDPSSDGRKMLPPCFSAQDYVYLLVQKGIWGSGGIHTGQESEFYNPGYIGQRVVCSGKIAERYSRKGKNFLVIEYQIDEIGGLPIAKHRLTAQTFENKKVEDREGTQED